MGEALVARRFTRIHALSLGILTALAGGAAAAAALIAHARTWLPALQLLPLVVVGLASLRVIRATGSRRLLSR